MNSIGVIFSTSRPKSSDIPIWMKLGLTIAGSYYECSKPLLVMPSSILRQGFFSVLRSQRACRTRRFHRFPSTPYAKTDDDNDRPPLLTALKPVSVVGAAAAAAAAA